MIDGVGEEYLLAKGENTGFGDIKDRKFRQLSCLLWSAAWQKAPTIRI